MRGREIIPAILSKLEVSQADLAEKLDISPANLWARLDKEKAQDISAALLAGTVEPLGYKVVVMPLSAPTPDNSYIIDPVSSERASNTRKKTGNKLDKINLDQLLN